jgi:hypothetical protein
MPGFMDAHPPAEVSARTVAIWLRELRGAPQTTDSAVLLDCLVGEHGEICCILDAPDAAAVVRWHAERDLPCLFPERTVCHLPGPERRHQPAFSSCRV